MLTDLKTLLERFANSTSFDDLFDSINQIYTDADRDPELKNFFKVRVPALIMNDEMNADDSIGCRQVHPQVPARAGLCPPG